MAIGLVIFWPALFFLEGGDGPEAQEYARLRGERDALEQVAVQKSCGLAIMDAQMPGPKPEPREPELSEFVDSASVGRIGRSPEARALPVLRQAFTDCTIEALLSYGGTPSSD